MYETIEVSRQGAPRIIQTAQITVSRCCFFPFFPSHGHLDDLALHVHGRRDGARGNFAVLPLQCLRSFRGIYRSHFHIISAPALGCLPPFHVDKIIESNRNRPHANI